MQNEILQINLTFLDIYFPSQTYDHQISTIYILHVIAWE